MGDQTEDVLMTLPFSEELVGAAIGNGRMMR